VGQVRKVAGEVFESAVDRDGATSYRGAEFAANCQSGDYVQSPTSVPAKTFLFRLAPRAMGARFLLVIVPYFSKSPS